MGRIVVALRGCAAGALACTAFGAMSSLPTADELERFIGEKASGKPCGF